MAEEGVPPVVAWGECHCVFVGSLESLAEGPTARSMPPIYNHRLTFTVTEVLRGQLPDGVGVGAALTCAHSARQLEKPDFPPAGTVCIVGAATVAARGGGRMMMMRGPGGGGGEAPSMTCMRVDVHSADAHAVAVLGCSLPFGWSTTAEGAIVSPWAALGADAWSPGEGSTIAAEEGAHSCSVTGRPVLGGASSSLRLSGAMVPPPSAADPSQPSKGGKPKGQFPGGWFEWGNPDGDGEYSLTLTNTGAEPVSVPALIRVRDDGSGGGASGSGTVSWAASLLVEHARRAYTLPTEGGAAAAKVGGEGGTTVHPTVLAPGESVETVVNVLRLDAPEIGWPRGGSRIEFTFWLGELSCGPFSLYYKSDHHDVLRKNMGLLHPNYQGVEAEPEPEPAA